MGELKLICQHLDRIISDYFVTQDEFFQTQAKLEALMKEGLLGMAKVRKHPLPSLTDHCPLKGGELELGKQI